jgi:hypothetical protein
LVRQRRPNYVKYPKARRIGGLNSSDQFRGFCIPQHMLCIVQLKAFGPSARPIGPAALRATFYSLVSSYLRLPPSVRAAAQWNRQVDDLAAAINSQLAAGALAGWPPIAPSGSVRFAETREKSPMRSSGSMHAQIGTLIIATSGVQLANGFFGTFISLRVALEDFDATLAGLVLSSYFAGFTLGAVRCGRIIERIGHIRAYAAFAGVVIAATVAMPLWVGPLPWLVLRAAVGFGCAGLFVTTESWLNAKAEPSERGRIFSLYMVGTFIALALGQLLIGPGADRNCGPVQRHRSPFRRGAGHGQYNQRRASPSDRRCDDALWPAVPRGTCRGRWLRAERTHRQRVLRACSGVDAKQGR